VIITKLQVAPVELVVSSESSCAVRLARHSQNAWARRVERVESRRDEPSGIRAYVMISNNHKFSTASTARRTHVHYYCSRL